VPEARGESTPLVVSVVYLPEDMIFVADGVSKIETGLRWAARDISARVGERVPFGLTSPVQIVHVAVQRPGEHCQ